MVHGSALSAGRSYKSTRERIKELQAKQRFIQDDTRDKVPELTNIAEPNEYVYYCYFGKGWFYAATEKMLLDYSRKGLLQSPWTEVAAVGDLTRKSDIFGESHSEFEVQTLKGPIILRFGQGSWASGWQQALRVHGEVKHAFSLHNMGGK